MSFIQSVVRRFAAYTFSCTVGVCAVGLTVSGAVAAAPDLGDVADARVVSVPNSPIKLKLWQGPDLSGRNVPHYSISMDGKTYSAARATSYELKLRAAKFDPLASNAALHPELKAGPDTNLYIVQFVTQPLQVFRDAIADLGGTVEIYVPSHSHIVKMTPDVRDAVSKLPYVRWVGAYEPGFRVESIVRNNVERSKQLYPTGRYNVMIFGSKMNEKNSVADRIAALGGTVDKLDAGKHLLVATLTDTQLRQVARFDDVMFIDRYGEYEVDMDKSRILSGANYVEAVAGYTGAGVRAESFDTGFNLAHVDFGANPLIEHGSVGSDSHGTACIGIMVGDGTGNPAARGIMPDAQGIVADYNQIGLTGPSRYTHSGELTAAPYFAVLQTASVGSPRTFDYTTISADTDAALFDFDIVHCQSQSNAGNQDSRPQAWAKNIISGGGVRHYDTLTKDDDCWCSGGSTGPAQDGRIKPDLSHFYDDTLTTTTGSPTSYTTSFGGTSGATPNICGYTGLFHQMWADGIFGNTIIPGTVWENRPHMTTAKAAMINTAEQYPFSGAGHDLGRYHQGWGMPNLQTMYDLREKMLIVDESDILPNLGQVSYNVGINAGEPAFKATLVFADPPGNPAAAEHRINDLTLRVVAPDGTIYWGNNGLVDNMWSTPGGAPNTVDTVENVFIENPMPGSYTIDVIASEINQDSHLETGAVDADFALVVSGGTLGPGFALGTTPGTATVCAPATAQFDIEITQFEGFTSPVAFSTIGVPAGATAAFTANNVVPPGNTSLIISDTDLATPGQHVIQVVGTTPELEKSVFVVLDLSTALPGDPTLVSPTDGETEVARQPSLTWNAATQGTSYALEVSTSPAFGVLDYSATVTDTSHDVAINLDSLTQYYWRVRATNGCGTGNDSPTFSFQTLEQPDYFTEEAGSGQVDLSGLSVTYSIDGTGDYYDACVEEITEFPADPTGGTELVLIDDDNELVDVGFLNAVFLYGQAYQQFYVGSNGYITFLGGDTDWSPTLAEHFEQPRISALYTDLNPNNGGTISWKNMGDRMAVTWDGVPEYNNQAPQTFQVEMYYNGVIRVSWLSTQLASHSMISGLSAGNGVPFDYLATDLSASSACGAGTCLGDLDGSGDVGFSDVLNIIGAWGPCAGCPEDLNENGTVDFADILVAIGAWGPCP